MASLRQIRRRMRSIDKINEITKAMGMIAGFRFRKAEIRYSRSRPYFVSLERLIANLSASCEKLSHPLFAERKKTRKALVLVTADKGLCGAYNSGLLKAAQNWLAKNADSQAFLVPVGKIGVEYCKRKHLPTLFSYSEKTAANLEMAKKMKLDLVQAFVDNQVDEVEILYASYKLGTAGSIRLIPYLGLGYLLENKAKNPVEHIYDPDFETVFFSLLEKYLEGKIFVTLLESLASEYSARMIAMKQATENGEEVLHDLKLLRNKTRQAAITKELSEIVSGASVLV